MSKRNCGADPLPIASGTSRFEEKGVTQLVSESNARQAVFQRTYAVKLSITFPRLYNDEVYLLGHVHGNPNVSSQEQTWTVGGFVFRVTVNGSTQNYVGTAKHCLHREKLLHGDKANQAAKCVNISGMPGIQVGPRIDCGNADVSCFQLNGFDAKSLACHIFDLDDVRSAKPGETVFSQALALNGCQQEALSHAQGYVACTNVRVCGDGLFTGAVVVGIWTEGGASGSPVFSPTGDLLGVVHASTRKHSTIVCPAVYLLRAFNRSPPSPPLEGAPIGRPPTNPVRSSIEVDKSTLYPTNDALSGIDPDSMNPGIRLPQIDPESLYPK